MHSTVIALTALGLVWIEEPAPIFLLLAAASVAFIVPCEYATARCFHLMKEQSQVNMRLLNDAVATCSVNASAHVSYCSTQASSVFGCNLVGACLLDFISQNDVISVEKLCNSASVV